MLEDFEIGDRVTWFDGHDVQDATIVGFEGSTVVLDKEYSPGVVWKIWPEYLRKTNQQENEYG